IDSGALHDALPIPVALTEHGEAMDGFARTILAAHSDAEAYFASPTMTGRLRFGAADDLALAQLPSVLRAFRQLHPSVQLELTVGQTSMLRRRLDANQLDLVFVKEAPGTTAAGGSPARCSRSTACSPPAAPASASRRSRRRWCPRTWWCSRPVRTCRRWATSTSRCSPTRSRSAARSRR